jgi:hypothetical protein
LNKRNGDFTLFVAKGEYDNNIEIVYGKVMKKVLVPSTETPEVVPKKLW